MSRTVPMTLSGATKLQQELRKLKQEDRPQIIANIAEARAHGDLKENAEYHAAKEQQGFIEKRIGEIEENLAKAEVIDVSKLENKGKVIFGATVTLINVESGEAATYQIVGDDEANLKEQKISVSSPIARAVIGKQVGDEVIVKTPGGNVCYEVDSVEYV